MFKLISLINSANRYVEFLNNQDKIINYFIFNRGGAEFLKFVELKFSVPDSLSFKQLREIDYIEGFMDMHFFSPRFYAEQGETLSDEIQFHPCKLISKQLTEPFFVAKFKKHVDLVDLKQSAFSQFSDGIPKLETVVTNAKVSVRFCARDIKYPLVSAVTQEFVTMALNEKYKLGFSQYL